MNRNASHRAVFLDRDGTITEEASYVGDVDKVVPIPGAADALKQLQDAGYKLFVITNQSGVGRGYFTREAVEAIHAHLDEYFANAGVRFRSLLHLPASSGRQLRLPQTETEVPARCRPRTWARFVALLYDRRSPE